MSIRAKMWTREEYDRLVRAGAFHPEARVQLVQGEILEMSPQSPAHAAAIQLAHGALQAAFGPGCYVRVQMPMALGEDSEPEPDLAVVTEPPRSLVRAHPMTAILVVEVADATLHFDRSRKGAVYAVAQIPEYWIVDLAGRALEVHRDPEGSTYRTVLRLPAGTTVNPLGAPSASLQVGDLLP